MSERRSRDATRRATHGGWRFRKEYISHSQDRHLLKFTKSRHRTHLISLLIRKDDVLAPKQGSIRFGVNRLTPGLLLFNRSIRFFNQ